MNRSSIPPLGLDLEITVEAVHHGVRIGQNQASGFAMRAIVFLRHGPSHNVSYYEHESKNYTLGVKRKAHGRRKSTSKGGGR